MSNVEALCAVCSSVAGSFLCLCLRWLVLCVCERRWFSGKISRSQRDAPGSIPGRRNTFPLLCVLDIGSLTSAFQQLLAREFIDTVQVAEAGRRWLMYCFIYKSSLSASCH